ncbi:MAG: alpha/beta fold hydrolase [Oscillochloridaceae bacterium]|nr:alpha/beta fold hydrolase [Chloroflexaceae bacterium]MDW8391901.1 alpha/beta fold hydrolase [Oscillochloridaceae bacterium]
MNTPISGRALSYEEALERLRAIAASEAALPLNAVGHSFALNHGATAERCYVLIHGYTNCPQQFRAFGELLHGRGHNVYVPRLPYHGLADRLNNEHGRMDRAALLRYLDDALAVARGLGRRVGIIGISAGAVLAAYAAQFRAEVEYAMPIAPVLGTPSIPRWATLPLANAARVLPNRYRWWDPVHKDSRRSPPHCYPRYATRVLGTITRMGFEVLRAARRRPPCARSIVMVLNEADEAVDNLPNELLAACWHAHGASVHLHMFPRERQVIHDCIDPAQELQQVDYVYPILLDLAEWE